MIFESGRWKRNTFSEIKDFFFQLTKFPRWLKRIIATMDEILQYDYHRNKFEKRPNDNIFVIKKHVENLSDDISESKFISS